MKDSLSYLISARTFENLTNFVDKLFNIFNSTSNFTTFVFDSKFVYEENEFSNIVYNNNDYSNMLKQISDYSDQIYDVLQKNNNNRKSISNVKDIVCVILGLDKFITSLAEDNKKLFDNIILKMKDSYKIHFIFIDAANSLKKKEFETWYKETVDSSCGLWVGNGFSDQYSIKPVKVIPSYYEQIGNSFGYLVNNGMVNFIKLIEKE